ncbi:Glycosyl hydrolases family 2, TIM barrel domain [Chitinophaga jiangningensis]|uniref:Glycosyl hydrolases family 2, TIM barrel domain n=1 Tax=Chitinophaga jiangningensis TaxID=1419482 RepID=A0A1M7BUA2_9BACT|nr:glycoside hydrolase family 2 [Chitinophaga jiangningensis]SHL58618.1 Glycosyl hydrolases family 2, TIM barrel domain [Chitinophaga jiangningensis]
MFKKTLVLLYACHCTITVFGQATDLEHRIANARMITTPYAVGVMDEWGEYPRPNLVRTNWINLNGDWKYQITDINKFEYLGFKDAIKVPYPIESKLSGVQKPLLPTQTLWYFKEIKSPSLSKNSRFILNFGAVDWQTEVFVNGKSVGKHTGGYDAFSFDITDYLHGKGIDSVVVAVVDPTDKGINPHGKQVLNPGNIYYTPTSGIWQTVWLEKVPVTRIENIKVTPDIDNSSVIFVSSTAGNNLQKGKVKVTVLANGRAIADGTGNVNSGIKIPLIKPRLWSPEDPFLYDVKVQLIDGSRVLDEVGSYFGMRKISVAKDREGHQRIQLNNKTIFNLGVLDQGFWPDGLYAAPSSHALEFDIATIKAMGFNTIRKHIKVEPQLWYYYADKLGMLVWQDFVNPPHGLPEGAKAEFEKELKVTLQQLQNHPSIISWVVFNEGWGAFDQERMTKLVKEEDPTRLVNGHSGQLLYVNNRLRNDIKTPWVASDIADIHSYPFPRPLKDDFGKVQAVGEFGGITVSVPYHTWNDLQTWGYDTKKPAEFRAIYRQMIDSIAVLEKQGLSAAIYTQPFDVETEENGFISYDRMVLKIPFDTLRAINTVLSGVNINQPVERRLLTAFRLINEADTDDKYAQYLKSIRGGTGDSALIRRMILLSMKKKDTSNTRYLTSVFLKKVNNQLNYDNVSLLTYVAASPDDPGYSVLLRDSTGSAQAIGEQAYQRWRKKVITNRFIKPMLASKGDVDWEKIESEVTQVYGPSGQEYIWGAAMMQNFNSKDWNDFGKYYRKYFEVAKEHSEYHINNMTWKIFENISDTSLLRFAKDVSAYNVKEKDNSAEAIDTYANLMYKLGEKDKAIEWEKKAVAARPDIKELADNLDKMLRGVPTWPVDSTKRN